MAAQRSGSAKKILPYHNILILQKSKNLAVKDQRGLPRGSSCVLFRIFKVVGVIRVILEKKRSMERYGDGIRGYKN